jgi:PAS domain S-box-containing protein
MTVPRETFESLLAEKQVLSELSVLLAEIDPSTDLAEVLSGYLRKITGTNLLIFFDVDETREMAVPYLMKAKDSSVSSVIESTWHEFSQVRVSAGANERQRITAEAIAFGSSLQDLSFGIIPETMESVIRAATVTDRFIRIAYALAGSLYGVSFVCLEKNQPDPNMDLLRFFAWMSAVNLRRKKEEGVLRLSEEKYKAVFTVSPDSISISRFDDGEYIDVNDSFLAKSGFSRQEVIGKSSFELNLWGDRADRQRMITALKEHGEVTDFETVVKLKNGQSITVLMSVRTFEIQGVTYLLAFTRDISGRKKTEYALQQSEQKYRLLAEHSADVIWLLSKQGRFTYVSPSILKLRGFTPEEVLLQTPEETLTPASAQKVSDLIGEAYARIARGEIDFASVPIILEQLCRDGSVVFTESVVQPMFDDDRAHTGFLGVTRNISERIQAENELRLAEKRFRMIIEKAADGIVLISPGGDFKYASPSAKKMFFYDNDDLLRYNPGELTHPDDLAMVLQNLEKLLADPAFTPVLQYRFREKNGSWRWIESTFTNMISEPSIEAIVINFRDINDRKNAEEEIRQMNLSLEKRVEERTTELTAANKELEAFAYTVSHDLRAPVRAIGGFTRILQEENFTGLDAEGQRVFRVILENTTRMELLIDDLLSFSRLSRTDMNYSLVSMNKIVNQCFEGLAGPDFKSKTNLTVTNLPMIRGDLAMLTQGWTNLISNAIKFTAHCEKPVITIGGYQQGDEYIYYIEDNGVGFDMKYADKLFVVFQRLHNMKDYEGTGVGLAIVHRIIHRHGGRIWAEGAVNRGAKFCFTLKPE